MKREFLGLQDCITRRTQGYNSIAYINTKTSVIDIRRLYRRTLLSMQGIIDLYVAVDKRQNKVV